MDYQGNVIRPPSEAASIILQVTVGCSHNKCTFCGAYKDISFSFKNAATIAHDLVFARRHFPHQKKVFLADGDVLIASQKRLVSLFTKIRNELPEVKRIRLYGNCKSIRAKSVKELQELKSLGLDRIYLGLESGSNQVLEKIKKGSTAEHMIEAGLKVKEAGIFLSVTILLGIGGKDLSTLHATETAKVINQMEPRQVAALTLMPMSNTPLYQGMEKGIFTMPSSHEMLEELLVIVKGIKLPKIQFQANHASNYLPINCRLSKDRDKVVDEIKNALSGERSLMPEYMRGL